MWVRNSRFPLLNPYDKANLVTATITELRSLSHLGNAESRLVTGFKTSGKARYIHGPHNVTAKKPSTIRLVLCQKVFDQVLKVRPVQPNSQPLLMFYIIQ